MYRHILIATDGSDISTHAVQHGVDLARAVGAKVSFLTATEPFHVFSLEADQLEDTRPEYEKRGSAPSAFCPSPGRLQRSPGSASTKSIAKAISHPRPLWRWRRQTSAISS